MAVSKLAMLLAAVALALVAAPGATAAKAGQQVTLFTPRNLDDPVAARKLLQEYYSGSAGEYYQGSASCGSWSSQTPYSNVSGTYQGYNCTDAPSSGRKMLGATLNTAEKVELPPAEVNLMLPSATGNPFLSRSLLQTYYQGSTPYSNVTVTCDSWKSTTEYSNDSGSYKGYNCTSGK